MDTNETHAAEDSPPRHFRALSSIAADVWHPQPDSPTTYEWWYFDAVSDDGRDSLIIIFLADFIFSPRYNRAASETNSSRQGQSAPALRFPALAFSFYRDGRPLLRTVNEYLAEQFSASTEEPACQINRSQFRFVNDAGCAKYVLTLDEALRRGERLSATLEWSVQDGDLRPDALQLTSAQAHWWNVAAPRCRVAGSINVTINGERAAFNTEFRGTGYHDHNFDRRWLPSTVAEWQWGRAHFADATAVFYRYRELGETEPVTRLFLVRDCKFSELAATYTPVDERRHIFGLSYPRELRVGATTDTGQPLSLRVTQTRVVDGSYFYLRFLGEAALDLGDGTVRRAPAISEHLSPRALSWRWLDFLTDMRIGRHGKPSFLK